MKNIYIMEFNKSQLAKSEMTSDNEIKHNISNVHFK